MKVSQIVQVYFMTMQSWFKLLQLIFLVSIQGQIQTFSKRGQHEVKICRYKWIHLQCAKHTLKCKV